MKNNLFVQKYFPQIELQPFIEYYWTGKSNFNEGLEREVNIFPITMDTLIFNLGDPPSIITNNNKPLKMAKSSVIGQITQKSTYILKGNNYFLAIRFKPLGLIRFFNICPSEFVNQTTSFDFYGKEVEELHEKICTAKNPGEVVNILNIYFLLKLADRENKQHKIDGIQHSIQQILCTKGNIEIKDLHQQLNLSEKGFRNKFYNTVGIAPKQFCRIIRFNNIYGQLLTSPKSDIHNLIFNAGYFDQAHFAKEFKHFTNASLSKFKTNFHEFDKLHRMNQITT